MPRNTWAARDAEADDVRRKLGVEDALAELDGLTPSMLVVLGEKGVKTLDDLADLASDELLDILPDGAMSEEEANTVIMGRPRPLVRGRGRGSGRRRYRR